MNDIAPKYSVGDLLDVRVEKIVPGGHGLAFAEGLTIFVELSAVGDRLRVKLREVIRGPSCEIPVARLRNLVHAVDPTVKVLEAVLAAKSFRVIPHKRYRN